MKYLFLDKLIQNFSEILNDNEEYNVIIEVGNELDKKTFTAHSVILRYRSSYFNKELKNTVPDINNIIKTITIQNISAEVFEIILKYIYYGNIDTENIDTKIIYKLMIAANELKLEELSIKLESHLIEFETSWLKTNFFLVYNSVFINNEFKNLKKFCDNIIVKNPKLIFESNEFTSLHESALVYIYYGNIDTENIDTKIIYKLMIAANELKLEELSIKLESHLIEFETSWLKTNFFLVYNSVFINNEFKNLKKFCDNIIVKNPKLIFESNEFTSLHESALVSILERDDLQMIESEIWDYLIKWGTAQNLTLPEKLEEWSAENFTTLKTILQQCLPLIRYFHISNVDVMDKIKPYKKIFDKQLWDDLKQHLIIPDRPVISIILPPRVFIAQELPPFITLAPEPLPRINFQEKTTRVNEPFSTIINEEHAAIISSWIDYKPTSYSLTNNPYEFQLILRGSKDGFAPGTFWDISHGHGNTIVICKVKETGEIIGGFNPLAWNKTIKGWMKTNKSFIFSFRDGSSQNPIFSRVKDENNAIFFHCHKNKVGPRFGKAEFMLKSRQFDFTKDCLNQCKKSRFYEKSPRVNIGTFSIIDYEVLQVVRKILVNYYFTICIIHSFINILSIYFISHLLI
ncbi:hypothetical protein Glove_230g211 [Diversispora epigaea]|uniref:BTB domain-containing protein n=1 Tax=Diversispora epigaea TaxID=1348612 RepID=A0A397IFE0_9GLOM|nr:hypothetical protein Glove_230g211 [Diversispora epigaea]